MKIVKRGFYIGMNLFEIAETDPAGNKTGNMLPKCQYYIVSYDEDLSDVTKNGFAKPQLEKFMVDQKEMKIPVGTKPFSKVDLVYRTKDVKDEDGKPAMRILLADIQLV